MLYRFNEESLEFKKVKLKVILKIGLILLTLSVLSFTTTYKVGKGNGKVESLENHLSELDNEERVMFIKSLDIDTFSLDALVIELKEVNIKFPHIVLAQSILETGNFQSNIFRVNNNLFGMKEARQRCKTAKGTNLGHAYYDHWKESVMDYALFQSAYLRDLKTEKQYLNYLDRNYAMAPNYDKMLINVINKNNLRELFDK